MAIMALSKPSIPSNLDEAAEKNFETMEVLEHENIFEETHHKIFKAGVEWMAGQGETQEHFVIGSIADSPCGPAVVCYTEEFEVGDNVIVQIRKKQ